MGQGMVRATARNLDVEYAIAPYDRAVFKVMASIALEDDPADFRIMEPFMCIKCRRKLIRNE